VQRIIRISLCVERIAFIFYKIIFLIRNTHDAIRDTRHCLPAVACRRQSGYDTSAALAKEEALTKKVNWWPCDLVTLYAALCLIVINIK